MNQKEKQILIYDFEVRYRFLSFEEGGRKTGTPFQDYRSDWAYEGDDIKKTGIYMIHPEFVDSNGKVLEKNTQVPDEGVAIMSILNKELRETIHKKRMKVGTKGFFMEGGRRVAEAEVIRIVGLMSKHKIYFKSQTLRVVCSLHLTKAKFRQRNLRLCIKI